MEIDYEKAYKAALATATQWIKDGCTDKEKICLECVFPQLRESEDERIRKLLVWQVHRNIEDETNDLAGSVYDGIKGHDPELEESIEDWKKCLAWLEKQKENSKSADSISSDYASDEKCEDRWHKVEDFLPDNGREVLAKDKLGNTLLARYDGEGWDVSVYDNEDYRCHISISKWCDIPSEKQKEQPAQSFNQKQFFAKKDSTPFEQELFLSLRAIKETKPSDEEIWLNVKEQLTPVLLSLMQKEQQPAEWSEEYREEDLRTRFAFYTYKDEDDALYLSNLFVEEASRNKGFGAKILKAAEKVAETIGASRICLKVKQGSPANVWYRKHGYGYMTFEDGYDWLEKNLEYVKPNKQEWSEEDEECLKELIQYIEQRLGDGTTGQSLWKKWHNWLKSLRPQPKAELTLLDENIINAAVAFVEQNDHFNCLARD